MEKLFVAICVAFAAFLALAAVDTVETATVNDLEPYSVASDTTFWTVSEHPAITVRVTTDGDAVAVSSILGNDQAVACDTVYKSSGSAFIELLRILSPGMRVYFR